MSWSGTGIYNLNPAYSPEVNGTTVDAVRYNGLTSDLAAGITACLAKNGENVPTANLPMGGFKHTGAAAATTSGQYVIWGQSATFGTVTATAFAGSGASLTALNGSQVTTGTVANARTTATSANTANAIVARDAAGSFSANVITASSFNGPATSAATATTASSTIAAVTFNNSGAGVASGTTFNGSTARVVSYNTIGAAPTASPTFTGTVTLPSTTSIGSVNSTEIGYLNGVAGNIQSQFDAIPVLTRGLVIPSVTNGTNVAETSLPYLHYMQIGATVSFSGEVTVDPTASGAATVVEIAFPAGLSASFSAASDASGCGVWESPTGTFVPAALIAVAGTSRIRLTFYANTTSAGRLGFSGHCAV